MPRSASHPTKSLCRNILTSLGAGYKTFFPRVGDYSLKDAPTSWTKVVSMRHALTKFPDCTYVWFLDQDAFIMNGQAALDDRIMKPSRLEPLMIKDHPVVPPDSIIKTFGHLKGKDVDLVLTQDKEGLSSGSFVIRNGQWAQFFLETWFDPLYRSYNFQKAETHALVSFSFHTTSINSHTRMNATWRVTYLCHAGTHRPMAPDHPLSAGSSAAADHQLL